MNFAGDATLRCWAIDVEIGGQSYTIPAMPASEWILPVASGSYLDIVPGLLEDPTVLDDLLYEGAAGEEFRKAARDAIAAAAGCKWWSAARLARAVLDTSWISAELTLNGVNPQHMSFAAYLAAMYRLVTRELEDVKQARLDAEIEQPPAGLPPEEWWDEDEAAANFEAAMAGG